MAKPPLRELGANGESNRRGEHVRYAAQWATQLSVFLSSFLNAVATETMPTAENRGPHQPPEADAAGFGEPLDARGAAAVGKVSGGQLHRVHPFILFNLLFGIALALHRCHSGL